MSRHLIDEAKKDPEGRVFFEAENDCENGMTAFANRGGGLTMAVSEAFAMDSYNETFECSFALSASQAIKLRDYLNEHFPK